MSTYSFADESGEVRLRGTLAPDPGGLPDPITDSLNVALPAGGAILDATIDTLDDAEANIEIDDNGQVSMSLSAGEGMDGYAAIFLADDDFDGAVNISTATGVSVTPRTGLTGSTIVFGVPGIFEVHADGSVHIKTGTSIQADL